MALIEGDDTRAAGDLRERIEARRGRRLGVDRRIDEIAMLDAGAALEALNELALTIEDPVSREAVERAQSSTYDRRASEASSRRSAEPSRMSQAPTAPEPRLPPPTPVALGHTPA